MPKTAIKVGPKDHGRPMSLADFEHAEVQEGYLYELSRGVIIVSDIPHPRHLAQVQAIRDQIIVYRVVHRGPIHSVCAGSDCKVLVTDFESERHPDIAVYKTPPPPGDDPWPVWVPEIVVEVISPGSERRDYEDKREEYLAFGIREYWIFNAETEEMLVLRRWGGRWREQTIRPGEIYRTRLLPGFEFDCAAVFAAARAEGT